MATTQVGVEVPVTVQAPRVISIDVFRGLTMIVMIFVNDLASVKVRPPLVDLPCSRPR